MTTLQLPADHLGLALAQAGADVLACTANAVATVLGYSFAGRLRNRPSLPDFGQAAAQSRSITFIAKAVDVAGAPVDLFPDAILDFDGQAYRIADRTNDTQLGQVMLHLEPVP